MIYIESLARTLSGQTAASDSQVDRRPLGARRKWRTSSLVADTRAAVTTVENRANLDCCHRKNTQCSARWFENWLLRLASTCRRSPTDHSDICEPQLDIALSRKMNHLDGFGQSLSPPAPAFWNWGHNRQRSPAIAVCSNCLRAFPRLNWSDTMQDDDWSTVATGPHVPMG